MNENSTIPALWSITRLGDEFICITGNTPSKKDVQNYGDKIPFVKPPQIFDEVISSAPEMLSEKGATKARILPKESVLVTCIGNLGRTAINNIPVAINQQINAILPSSKCEAYYLFFFAQSMFFREQLVKLASATTIPIVNKNKFENITIWFPPLSEQRAIVTKIEELLSDLENGKQQLLKAQEQLKVYRQSLLKAAFEGRLNYDFCDFDDSHDSENTASSPENHLNHMNHSHHSSDTLPEGWKWAKLGEVIQQPKYGTAKKCSYDMSGKAVLRIPNVINGSIDNSDLKYAEFNDDEVLAYSLIEGDILTIRSNGSVDIVGKSALVKKKDENYLYAGYLIRLRPRLEKIVPKYLLYALFSTYLRNQIELKAKSTSGVNNINSEELKSLILPLCSIGDQKRIVDILDNNMDLCDKIEETITQSLAQAETLKQSIFKKAFEGKLV